MIKKSILFKNVTYFNKYLLITISILVVLTSGICSYASFQNEINGTIGIRLTVKQMDNTAPIIGEITKAIGGSTYTPRPYINISITDEVGVVAYQVTTTNIIPTTWIDIESSTSVTQSFNIPDITTASTYYVFAKDAAGNISIAKSIEMTTKDLTFTRATSITGVYDGDPIVIGNTIDPSKINITYNFNNPWSSTIQQPYTTNGDLCTLSSTILASSLKISVTCDHHLASDTLTTDVYIKTLFTYSYTGAYQTFSVGVTGNYTFELWGSSGGTLTENRVSTLGNGAYTKGTINLNAGENIFVFVGERGKTRNTNCTSAAQGGWNGGGNITYTSTECAPGGGGATDIRLLHGSWNNSTSLRNRIMVAGAGGGGTMAHIDTTYSSNAGGLTGYRGLTHGATGFFTYVGYGGSQTTGGQVPVVYPVGENGTAGGGGSFGHGGNGGRVYDGAFNYTGGAGAGSGYFGGSGGSGAGSVVFGGGGGSSYISGHTGCVAITSETNQNPLTGCTTGTTNNSCSLHYSGKVFTDTKIIDGGGINWTNVKGSLELMPTPSGGTYPSGGGHVGNGYVKITFNGI